MGQNVFPQHQPPIGRNPSLSLSPRCRIIQDHPSSVALHPPPPIPHLPHHHHPVFPLVSEDLRLGMGVGCHRAVPVHVVGGEIGDQAVAGTQPDLAEPL